jgi:iron(III) transport system substrate-binding protein
MGSSPQTQGCAKNLSSRGAHETVIVYATSRPKRLSSGLEREHAPAETDTDKPKAVAATADSDPKLVVLTDRSLNRISSVFQDFKGATGIEVELHYLDSTQKVIERAKAERSEREIDLIFVEEGGYLEAIAKEGVLAKGRDTYLHMIPPSSRGFQNRWVPVSGRARVLAYHTRFVKPVEFPAKLEDLPGYRAITRRVGWAPESPGFQAHISMLRKHWGEERTKDWLIAMKELEPRAYESEAQLLDALLDKEVEVAWLEHSRTIWARANDHSLPVANYHFPTEGDPGNLIMMSGVGIISSTRNLENARKLVEYLLSLPGQEFFSFYHFEYPARVVVVLHQEMTNIGRNAPVVRQKNLVDDGGTGRLLAELGLLPKAEAGP